ncbi:MAG: multimeric flavodoxin WrbA [Saprospiraceae bacterium]|jgi:multimeric flavodoxin WrbA
MPNLLIVCNTPTKNTHILFDAVVRGANSVNINHLTLRAKQPLDASSDDVLWCDAIIIGTTEHFGAMSGQIKDFFERIYYPCLDEKQGLATALYIKAALDGNGTQIGVEKIFKGLRWRLVQPTLMLHGAYHANFVDQCEELGQYMAAGLDAGIF